MERTHKFKQKDIAAAVPLANSLHVSQQSKGQSLSYQQLPIEALCNYQVPAICYSALYSSLT